MIGWVNDDGEFDATSFDSRTLQECGVSRPNQMGLEDRHDYPGRMGSAHAPERAVYVQ